MPRKRLLSALAAVVVAAGACTEGTEPAPVAPTDLRTLDRAVEEGIVAGTLVDELHDTGETEGIVTLRGGSAIREILGAPGAGDQLDGALEELKNVFARMRDQTFSVLGTEVRILDAYDFLPAVMVGFTSEDALLSVANAPFVEGVSAPTVSQLHTDQSLPLVRATQAIAAGHRGAGTYVAVLDTGLDYTNPAFGTCAAPGDPGCSVALVQDFGTDDGELDNDGHGTSVAGIVHGVAPDALILGFDVFGERDDEGNILSHPEHQLAAIDEVIRLKGEGYDIKAINMSLGSPETFSDTDCETDIRSGGPNVYRDPFAELRSLGIIPVLSAGNYGASGKSGVGWPGCSPGAMRIGSVFDTGGFTYDVACTQEVGAADEVTCYSQSGPSLSMWAPGACVVAAGIDAGQSCYGGTSQAAPHVAGAVAVLSAARPDATTDQVQAALESSGPLIADERSGGAKHRLNLVAALRALGVDTTGVDTTKPTVTAPEATTDATLTAGVEEAEVTVSWTGSDEGGSGIVAYTFWVSVDAGDWEQLTLPVATATSMNQTMEAGSTYQWAVNATDAAGNVSDWVYSPTYELP